VVEVVGFARHIRCNAGVGRRFGGGFTWRIDLERARQVTGHRLEAAAGLAGGRGTEHATNAPDTPGL
jgi:hypothetical protein